MSGSLTISISGTPERFRSIEVHSLLSGSPSCRLLPASSSRCTRVMPIRFGPFARLDFDVAVLGQRLVVLRNLVALGQIGIEIILAREDRGLVDLAVQRRRGQHRKLHRLLVQHRQRAGQSQAYRTDIGVRRIAKAGRAAAEDLGLRQQLDVDFESDDRLVLGLRRDRGFRRGGHTCDYSGDGRGIRRFEHASKRRGDA